MKNKKPGSLASLTAFSILLLSGCMTTEYSEISHHATGLTFNDQYTLVSNKHFLKGYPPIDSSGNINVVVEIPSGTNDKWEVDKTTGHLKWEFNNGDPRVVSYLGYPGNYGMIPRTLLPKALGGDGDPLDVIIIGSNVLRGSVVKARPIGVLKLLDDGEQDDKIIAVLLDSEFNEVLSIEELNQQFKGVTEIIQIWFSNYKGPGRMKSKGFGNVTEAQNIIRAAVNEYRNKLTKK